MKLIIARHLIPCTGGRAQVTETETGILIENGLIRRVDRLDAFEEERRGGKVEIIDAGDNYVLPGLIDAHLHLSFSSSAQPLDQLYGDDEATVLLRMVRAAQMELRSGVTTVRDSGSKACPFCSCGISSAGENWKGRIFWRPGCRLPSRGDTAISAAWSATPGRRR